MICISTARQLFPPALATFGVNPERMIFLDIKRERDVLWTMNEALKCDVFKAVVGETRDLTFADSRRLQLAVEHSHVTGFVLRHHVRKINATACVSRWKISPMPTDTIDHDFPGMGIPKWRVRNGLGGTWNVQWENDQFISTNMTPYTNRIIGKQNAAR